MAEISDLQTTDANNVGRFPEGQHIPTINNGARALEGILARHHRDTSGYTATTGTGVAYQVLTSAVYPAHAAGMVFLIRAHTANTGAATLQVNALAAKPLVRQGGAPLAPRDIANNQLFMASYNTASDSYECVGVGTTAAARREVNPFVALPLANGANANVNLGEGLNYLVSGPTGAFSLSGLTNGVDGREIRIVNNTAQAMTITNDATSTAANRFLTLTGADITTTAQGAFTFVYSSTAARWIQVGNQT